MKLFTKNYNGKIYNVICDWQRTRYGVRHLAELQDENGYIIAKDKVCYYNRTWESYEYQSVCIKVCNKAKLPELAKMFE